MKKDKLNNWLNIIMINFFSACQYVGQDANLVSTLVFMYK